MITLKSLKLKQKLQQMQQDMSGRVSARIRLPEELKWWYFQEFGTGSRSEFGGSPYTVHAHKKDGTPGKEYQHPGIPPRRMVTKVLDQIRAKFGDDMVSAIKAGQLSRGELRAMLMTVTMPYAVDVIADSFASELPGTSPHGKLKGQSAADVYKQSAQIVDTSDE